MKKKVFSILTLAMSLLGSVSAFAAGASPAGSADGKATPAGGIGGSWWIWILIYGGMFAIFYFLLIRPNKKKRKAEEDLRNNIVLGDEITTIGGIVGRVVSIKDEDITVESSIDRTLVQFKKWAVRDVKKLETDDEPKTLPEEDKKADKKKKD